MSDNNEAYPELTPGTLYKNDLGLWVVIDRQDCESTPDAFDDIEIESMAIQTDTMQTGRRELLNEIDIGVGGEIEVIEAERVSE